MWPRGAFGLRGRIVGAVIVTTVATLVVAALALLGPLEHSLRTAALTTLKNEMRGQTQTFGTLQLRYVLDGLDPSSPNYRTGSQQGDRLTAAQVLLDQRIGATAFVLGYPDANGENAHVLAPPRESHVLILNPQAIARAFRTGKPQYGFTTVGGVQYALAAVRFTSSYKQGTAHDPDAMVSVPYVLAVAKPIDEITAAVHSIRTAFLYAALAGLLLTFILAIPLSGRLVRRLRRLRESALRLAREGPDAPVPADRVRDEVGDLARTFALMQLQLRQQEAARRAFVATASHELRTPLTSLDGMLELLEDELTARELDLDDARSLLHRARAQSHRLGRLAADLLDLSRIDAQVQLRSEPVELGELSRAVLAEFELGIGERGIRAALQDAGEAVWALGDPGSVARILRILLDNALRVSPAGSTIAVDLHGGAHAVLSVCDQGPGVPADERELIFERFHRGRNTSGQAGFGLGLAIGRELAERMGGELTLEERPGSGATFTLRLPVATAPDQDALAVL